jgi:palmitoyltransferase
MSIVIGLMDSRLNIKKLLGNFFVLFVLLTIGQIYYVTVIQTYLPLAYSESSPSVIAFLILFHIESLLLLWCFVKVMAVDPGNVPRYWGFYMGDSEMKRRRYCLMCHVFKPERCHHCSTCNRCVLNMDHHCPWINNCVGFYNRKFFMLLLLYVLLTTYTVDVALFSSAYSAVWSLYTLSPNQFWTNVMLLGSYSLNVSLSIAMTMFLRFHVSLVMANKTTIDTMDKRPVSQADQRNDVRLKQFNIGPLFNFVQVFGRNPWLWLLPITGLSGKPVGDGVTWRTVINTFAEEEIPDNEVNGRSGPVITHSANSGTPRSGAFFSVLASPQVQQSAVKRN